MDDIYLHNAVLKYNTLELLSADYDFYRFVGNRQFDSFDKLIHQDNRSLFLSKIERRDTAPFVVDMLGVDDVIIPSYIHISYNDNAISIELQSVENLRNGQELYRRLHSVDTDLLGLHNDIIFSYSSSSGMIKLYSPDFKRITRTCEYKEFIAEIEHNIKQEDSEKLEAFATDLKLGASSFVYTFKGKILNISDECKYSIVKGLSTVNFGDATIVGYIHRGSNKAKATFTIERDALTGAYSKQEISNIARRTIDVEKKKDIAVCIIDIDYFKNVNDKFGHLMGDKVLKEVADIIIDEVGNNGVVGRFGGDEFLVLLYGVDNMFNHRDRLKSIKNRVSTRFPMTSDDSSVSVTLSIGCAVCPHDTDNYNDLFCLADFCLYKAKEKGRNRYIIYNFDAHGTVEDVKNYFNNNRRIDSRKDMAMGDVLCMIEDKHYDDSEYTADMLVDDLVENLTIERIICLSGSPYRFSCMSGINLPSVKEINDSAKSLYELELSDSTRIGSDIMIINNVNRLNIYNTRLFEIFEKNKTKSFIAIKFKDAAGKDSLVLLESTVKKISWNLNQTYNYKKIARMLGNFEL